MTIIPRIRGSLFAGLLVLIAAPVSAQLTPDQAADMLLTSARKGFNDKNYPFAATRFREFLTKFGGHKDATSARYGLALALLEAPEKDRNHGEIQQLFTTVLGDKNFADRALTAYYLGQSY